MDLKLCRDIYSYYLEVRGYKHKIHKLDNETSREVEHFIIAQKALFQYAPSGQHRANAAERAIQTFKGTLKSGLFISLPDSFPMSNRCKLCP